MILLTCGRCLQDELRELFKQAGLDAPQIFSYRMEGELEDLMSRSFPNAGDADRVRRIYAESISDDTLDLNTRLVDGKIFYSMPVAVLVAQKQSNSATELSLTSR